MSCFFSLRCWCWSGFSFLKRDLRFYPFPLCPFNFIFQSLLLGPLNYFYLTVFQFFTVAWVSFFFFLHCTCHRALYPVDAKFVSVWFGCHKPNYTDLKGKECPLWDLGASVEGLQGICRTDGTGQAEPYPKIWGEGPFVSILAIRHHYQVWDTDVHLDHL